MKQKKLRPLNNTLNQIMLDHPKTEKDDYLLYCFYLNTKGISKDISLWELRSLIKAKKVCTIETVSRAKRDVIRLTK